MFDKSKRKHDSRMLFKLKLILIAFIIGTLLASFFPMIWLAPPLFALTPFVYIGLSLLWIPILWRVLCRVTLDRVVKGLMIGCIISTMLLTHSFNNIVTTNPRCHSYNLEFTGTSQCFIDLNESCYIRFDVIPFGNLFLAIDHPIRLPASAICNVEL